MYPIPANATRIRYLESTGTQWINAGVTPDGNTAIDSVWTIPSTSSGTLCGGRTSGSEGQFYVWARPGHTNPSQAWRFGYGTTGAYFGPASAYTTPMRVSFGPGYAKFGSAEATFSSQTFSGTRFYIFALCNGASSSSDRTPLKLHWLKIWQSGTLVRSFVPVRVGQVGCLFDRVTGQFFYNQGTGSFVCGEDDFSIFSHSVKHVEVVSSRPYDAEVEYIESTGTQYIDTGITVTMQEPFTTECGIHWNSTGRQLMGWSTSGKTYWGIKNTADKQYELGSINANFYASEGIDVIRHEFMGSEFPTGQTVYRVGGTESHLNWGIGTVYSGKYLILCLNRGYWCKANLYWFKFWYNGVLIRDYIPVRVGTEYCLYDKANPTGGDNGDGLYHNKGTGVFLGGSDTGPSIVLASRVMGDSSGTVKAVRKHYDMPMQYTVDECNGNSPTVVNTLFPSSKYDALDYTPTWEHHRFVGWYSSPYDAEIEYIQSTGTQAIDTGITPAVSDTFVFDIDASFSSIPSSASGAMCGSGSTSGRIFVLVDTSGHPALTYKSPHYSTTTISAGTRYSFRASFAHGSQSLSVDGSVVLSASDSPSNTPSDPIHIFGVLYNGRLVNASNMRLFAFSITVNGVRVRDYIPVRVGQVGYLFDKVSGQLFGNVITGNFILGADLTSHEVSASDNVVFDRPTVYAHWQLPTTVTFDATTNGGQMPSGWVSPDYYEGQPYGTLPTPTKSGEVFLGWFTSGGTRVTTSSVVSAGTLTARYAAVTYDTSFQVTTTSSYRKTGVYSAASRNSSNPTVVDWGDGTTDVVYGNISQLAHTYSSNGTFTVQVNDNISNIALSTNNNTWYDTTSQNRYTVKKLTALGANITALPSAAFMYCSAMTDALLPSNSSFKTIPQNCFAYCTTLKPVTIPSTVTTITDRAFQYINGSQFTSVTIPAAVTSIGQYAFYNCYYLKNITLESGSAALTLGTYAFSACFYQAAAVGTIDLSPRKITSIPNYCFHYCRYLKGVTWPQGLTRIGGSAFRYCFYFDASTGTVEIPEGVTSISSTYAFANCLYLTAVTLPSTLTNLNNYTFYYCTRLATITSNRTTAPTVSSATFGNGTTYYTGRTSYSAGTNKLYVPAGSTGYNASYWLSPLCNSAMCGFTLVQAVSITFDASTGGGTMPSGWTAPNYWPGLAYGTLPVPEKSGATFDGWFLNGTLVTESSIVPAGGATLVAQFSVARQYIFRAFNNATPNFDIITDYPFADGAVVTGRVESDARSGHLVLPYSVYDANDEYIGEFIELTPGTSESDFAARWWDRARSSVWTGYAEIIDVTPGQKRVLDITYNGDTARVEIDWDSKSISVISPGSSDLSGIYVFASEPTAGAYEFDMFVSGNPNDGPTGPMLMIFAYDNSYNKEFFNHYKPVVVGTGVAWTEVTS